MNMNPIIRHVLSYLRFILCSLLLVCSSSLYALHSVGADLVYFCNPDGSYTITLTYYRDCEGGWPPPPTADITISSASCGMNEVISLNPVGQPLDVSPICPDQQDQTTCNFVHCKEFKNIPFLVPILSQPPVRTGSCCLLIVVVMLTLPTP